MSKNEVKNNFKTAVKEMLAGDISSNAALKESSQKIEQVKADLPAMPLMEKKEIKKSDSFSVLAEDIILEGNITTKLRIDIHGQVKGNVFSKDQVNISGKVEGNVEGINVVLSGGLITGNVTARGLVKADEKSVVIGNLAADSLELKGKIEGDIQVSSASVFSRTAIAMSNIITSSISVETGSIIIGHIKVDQAVKESLISGKGHEEKIAESTIAK